MTRRVKELPVSKRLDEQHLEAIEERTVPAAPSVPQLRDDVFRLLAEVRALRTERDRLRDGIAADRDWVTAEGLAGTLPSKRLWSLLDGEADDE